MKVICDRTGIDIDCCNCIHSKPHDLVIYDDPRESCDEESICGCGIDLMYSDCITKCISVEEYEHINNVKIN